MGKSTCKVKIALSSLLPSCNVDWMSILMFLLCWPYDLAVNSLYIKGLVSGCCWCSSARLSLSASQSIHPVSAATGSRWHDIHLYLDGGFIRLQSAFIPHFILFFPLFTSTLRVLSAWIRSPWIPCKLRGPLSLISRRGCRSCRWRRLLLLHGRWVCRGKVEMLLPVFVRRVVEPRFFYGAPTNYQGVFYFSFKRRTDSECTKKTLRVNAKAAYFARCPHRFVEKRKEEAQTWH